MRLVLVGRLAGAFGVRGEVRIRTFGEDPLRLLDYGALLDCDGRPLLTPLHGRAVKGELVCRPREELSKEAADALRGTELFVPRERLPPPEADEFYHVDLIGLEARGVDGGVLGRIRAVPNFGAGDLLEIDPPSGPSFYLPFTREAAPEIHLEAGWVLVIPPAEDE